MLGSGPRLPPWRHRGQGSWRMAFLLVTCGVSKPEGLREGLAPTPESPGTLLLAYAVGASVRFSYFLHPVTTWEFEFRICSQSPRL